MHFYVTGYKFGMMVLVSLSFSRCVNFVGRGTLLYSLPGLGLGLEPSGLGLGLERFGLDNNTGTQVQFSPRSIQVIIGIRKDVWPEWLHCYRELPITVWYVRARRWGLNLK